MKVFSALSEVPLGDYQPVLGLDAAPLRTLLAVPVAIPVAVVVAGVLITSAAALLPAALLRRLPTAHLLAEE